MRSGNQCTNRQHRFCNDHIFLPDRPLGRTRERNTLGKEGNRGGGGGHKATAPCCDPPSASGIGVPDSAPSHPARHIAGVCVMDGSKKWRCYWCGYVTTNEVFLELHLKWHRPEHAWAAAAAAPQPVTANPHPREAIVDGSSLQGQFSGCDAAAAASSRRGTAGTKGRPRREHSDGRRPGSAQREVVTSSGHAADAPILGAPACSQGKNGKNGKNGKTSPQRGSSGQTRAVAPHSSRNEGKGRTVGKKKRNASEKQSVKRVNQSVAEGSTHSGSTQAIASFEIGQRVEALDHASRWRVGEVEMVLWGDTSSTESSTADLSAVKVKFTSPGKGTTLWYPMRSGRLRQVGQINLTSKRTEVDRLTTSKKSSTQARSNRAQTSKSKVVPS